MSAHIRLYYTDIRDFLNLRGLSFLTPERRERLKRYLHAEDRARCLAAGLLLRRFISDQEPQKGPWGKPYIPHAPQFNLSHSGSYVVLAVSGHSVGVDIEQHRPFDLRVARRCFTPDELRWLTAHTDPVRAFYILWTAKECIMKATGLGFHMPPETFAVCPDISRGCDSTGQKWHLAWTALAEHTVCTACAKENAAVLLHRCGPRELGV